MDYRETIRAAIRTFGERNQTIVAIEELSELQKELCKMQRGKFDSDRIAEEVADVRIMLAQLMEMFNLEEMVDTYERFKIERLQRRIAAELEREL